MDKPQGWDQMTPAQRENVRDLSCLTPALVGLEGWRVEVVTERGETERFIVGRSTGWRPCHITLKLRTSHGGVSADSSYRSVRKLYKVRP